MKHVLQLDLSLGFTAAVPCFGGWSIPDVNVIDSHTSDVTDHEIYVSAGTILFFTYIFLSIDFGIQHGYSLETL
jgi:hypothetical protein